LSSKTIQEAIDSFIRCQHGQDLHACAEIDECFNAFSDYLLCFSDLFHDEEDDSEEIEDWEQELQDHMDELMNGDIERLPDLGMLKCTDLSMGHLSDFIGWYLPRTLVADSDVISTYCRYLREWLNFMVAQGWVLPETHAELISALLEQEPESLRVITAAQLLFHYVRQGRGISSRLRAHRFSRFHEGNARIVELKEGQIWLQFDGHPTSIGPVVLAAEIIRFLRTGDVLDLELGLRGDTWLIVDIGPVYPHSVYVEAEELLLHNKIC